MQTFFSDLQTLHAFTIGHHRHHESCPHCSQSGNLISHGFVYKKSLNGRTAVGKRLFCSNRHQKTGCGKTTRLYLAQYIPHLHYKAHDLFIFIVALISSFTIKNAYPPLVPKNSSSRHAYRWLAKIKNKLSEFRLVIKTHHQHLVDICQSRTPSLQILLPTLGTLYFRWGCTFISQYQIHFQEKFI